MANWGQRSVLDSGLLVVLLLGNAAVCSCSSMGGFGEVCNRLKEKRNALCQEKTHFVCSVCQTSNSGQTIRSIEEAASHLRDDLKLKVESLKRRAEIYDQSTKDYIQTQAQDTEKKIKQEIEKLHQFLRDEEAARIAALEAELPDSKISHYSEKIRKAEEALATDTNILSALAELKSYAATETRFSGLINMAEHVGNLEFKVWRKMQEKVQYTPVVLDPNTANRWVVLSDDLSTARRDTTSPISLGLPGRVLGSEAFTSGSHSWDVEVGENNDWTVGVETESLESGPWAVWCKGGVYGAMSPLQPHVPLSIKQTLQRIRVQLDLDGRKVSFFNPGDNTLIHTFTHTFTERVLPYFRTMSPLRVLPVEVSVII